jgi:hypothetical protein
MEKVVHPFESFNPIFFKLLELEKGILGVVKV